MYTMIQLYFYLNILFYSEVNWNAAYATCLSKLRIDSPHNVFTFRVINDLSKEIKEDVPVGGFRIKDNSNFKECMQPPRFLLKLYPEQLRTVTWMMQMESCCKHIG